MTSEGQRVLLAHGEGGRLSRRLLHEVIIPRLGDAWRGALDDAADIEVSSSRMALTTDSYVVTPIEFPGGDIGSLAVNGTVNDLAVRGARPVYLTLSMILEEGLSLDTLCRVLDNVAAAARAADVAIVAGDTKVVARGSVDGLFLNTAGVGFLPDPSPPGPASLEVGDAILVSGPIGRHGVAVMAAREQLGVSPAPISDSAPLHRPCQSLRERLGSDLRAMRDATRGGVAAVLQEWADSSGLRMALEEAALPVLPETRGVCELLGIDPVHVANEGTFVAAIAPDAVSEALAALREHRETERSTVIGQVAERQLSAVTVRGLLGVERPLDEPQGAPLPRIC